MLDGATGETRWDCPLWPGMQYAYDSLIHLLAAPDLDADGTRDLIVVSRFMAGDSNASPGKCRSRAESTWMPFPARTARNSGTGAPTSIMETRPPLVRHSGGAAGPDGWPMLALPIGGGEAPGRFAKNPYFTPDPPVVHLLAAATGREAHVVEGLSRPGTADLDGDGLADLWGRLTASSARFALGRPRHGVLSVGSNPPATLTATASATWSVTTSRHRKTVADPKPDSGTAIARSGRDGRILWQALLDPWENRFFWGEWAGSYGVEPLKLPAGDLDGDGAPDIVVHRSTSWTALNKQQRARIRLQALSGRTGRALWSAGALPYVDASIGIPGVCRHRCSRM